MLKFGLCLPWIGQAAGVREHPGSTQGTMAHAVPTNWTTAHYTIKVHMYNWLLANYLAKGHLWWWKNICTKPSLKKKYKTRFIFSFYLFFNPFNHLVSYFDYLTLLPAVQYLLWTFLLFDILLKTILCTFEITKKENNNLSWNTFFQSKKSRTFIRGWQVATQPSQFHVQFLQFSS